jgi:VWFA-related protein
MKRTIVLACGVVASAPLVCAAQAVFSSGVEAVRVDVLVTRSGRPVRDLRPQDFALFDDGVEQQVDFASFEQIPLNVVIGLDMSSSVAGERLEHLRAAVRALLEDLREDDQAGLVTFGHAVAIASELTRDRSRVREALDAARPRGQTSLVDASFTALALGESDVGRALVILFSDGLDTSSWLNPDAVLRIARRTDAVVYAVCVRGAARPEFLRDLADITGGDLLQVESVKDVSATFLAILNEFRHRYLLSYSPRGVSKDGWHRLEVRVRQGGVAVRSRPGYLAGTLTPNREPRTLEPLNP